MEQSSQPKYPNIERLIGILETLRGENGCAWDREQTHYSLKKNMIEEAYEAVDAIEDNDMKHLEEELGDVLLQVVLHSQIAKEEKVNELNASAEKLKSVNSVLEKRQAEAEAEVEAEIQKAEEAARKAAEQNANKGNSSSGSSSTAAVSAGTGSVITVLSSSYAAASAFLGVYIR